MSDWDTADSSRSVRSRANVPNFRQLGSKGRIFQKFMQVFRYVHPAALHAIIHENNYNYDYCWNLLWAGYKDVCKKYWDTVTANAALEKTQQQERLERKEEKAKRSMRKRKRVNYVDYEGFDMDYETDLEEMSGTKQSKRTRMPKNTDCNNEKVR